MLNICKIIIETHRGKKGYVHTRILESAIERKSKKRNKTKLYFK